MAAPALKLDPMDAILETFARDAAAHVMGSPSTSQDLRDLTRVVGRPLPAAFAAFLARFGGGLFYQGHEIFGPQRVMIHDIELVPSLGTMLRLMKTGDAAVPDGVVPFHRSGGVVHLFDLREAGERIVSAPYGAGHAGFASFLRSVVIPAAPIA